MSLPSSPGEAGNGAALSPLDRPTTHLAEPAASRVQRERLSRLSRIASAISATTSDAIICADADGRIHHWNASAEALFGRRADEVIGRDLSVIIPEHLRAAHKAGFARMVATGVATLVGRTVEVPGLHADGHEIPIELSLTMWPDAEGRPAGFGAIIRDLTARKAAEAELAREKAFVDAVIEHLPVMLFVKDGATRQYRLFNRAGEEATGMSRAQVVGRNDHDLGLPDADDYARRDIAVMQSGATDIHESVFERAPGDARILRTRRVAMPGSADDPGYLIGITEDITERREAQEKLAYLAHHDPLTGLANRARFAQSLDEALPSAPVVMCIDLDRFKAVNDRFGHATGDQLLRAVARKLERLAGDDCIVGRLGGDEFALVVPGPDAPRQAERIARAIVTGLAEPFLLDGRLAHVGASVGIAVAVLDGSHAPELLDNADLALYRAKKEGRGRFCFFEAAMDRAARERRELEADLRTALTLSSIDLHYQPLACLETGQVSGFEVLARWTHPTRGAIPPDVFIPIAEETGIIGELGKYILRRAACEAVKWAPPLRLAVNLSPLQFAHGDLASDIEAILDEAGLDPQRLEIEITEGLLMRDAEQALVVLNRLKQLGIRIAMDDFGTGYSSLSYFRQFPFDKVKIDQSFIREMGSNRQALAVVQAVIGLGRGLGMPVVAEGVETQEQLDGLRAEGCTEVQGFLIGRPGPIENYERVVVDRDASSHLRSKPGKA